MNLPTPSWSTYPAQAAVLQWAGADGSTNTIAFDIVETETWQEDATVTEHPVEVARTSATTSASPCAPAS
jgi:hypothetical protein